MNVKNSHTASRNFVTGILLLHEAMFPNYNKERSMEGGREGFVTGVGLLRLLMMNKSLRW